MVRKKLNLSNKELRQLIREEVQKEMKKPITYYIDPNRVKERILNIRNFDMPANNEIN